MSLASRVGRAWSRQCLSRLRPTCFSITARPVLSNCPPLKLLGPPNYTLRRGYSSKQSPVELEARIAAIPIERYRNFCIVAHIDHGKSTLSDRLLELTGTISASDANKQILDKLDVERERGITVKAQTCTMIYNHNGEDYLLHLVDTPGHVDFRAEVTRSYASCGGALLLVDATQGIQAQTVSNFHLAFAQDLALVPVVNKIDMISADVPRVLDQMESSFELDPKDAILLSAKTGKGVPAVLPVVIDKIPHPNGDEKKPLKMLLVDSWYDNFRGVVCLVRVFDGVIQAGDNVVSLGTDMKYTVGQVGIQYPNATTQQVLRAGQVGYVYFNPGMKRIQDAKLGDTFTKVSTEHLVEPCPGFEEPKPMVFVAAFPTDQSDYGRLADSINQLVLNDRSVTLQKDFSEALGSGWRLGFLGSLHCSVFQDRLRQEHGRSVIITEPTVPTKIVWPDGSEEVVENPALFPDTSHPRIRGAQLYEPFVKATITMPEEYIGRVIELCEANRGEQKSLEFFHATQVILVYDLPAAQLVDDFFGKLKGATKGYATLDYEEAGWRLSNLVKLQLLVNRQPVDAICRIVHTSQVDRLGRQWVTKFKEHVDRQMFEVVIQAVVGNRVVARETIKPFRKDVLAKLHAADVSRRKKLLEKQKEGRKRLRAVGNDYGLHDPPLSELGIEQCAALRQKLASEYPAAASDVAVIASPMRRTLQTALLSLDWLVDRGVKIEANADWQENSEKPCDTGSDISSIAPDFPGVDFSHVDPVWPDKTSPAGQQYAHTREAILARGRRCLDDLYQRPEKLIFIVSHSGFLRLGVVGWWFFNSDYRVFNFDEAMVDGKFEMRQHENTISGGMGLSFTKQVALGLGLPNSEDLDGESKAD